MFWVFCYVEKSERGKCWLDYDCILKRYLEVDVMVLLGFEVIEGG